MKVLTRRFNIYLVLGALLASASGCQTIGRKASNAALRVHIQLPPEPNDTTLEVSVLRSTPVMITIQRQPILSEANLLNARVVEAAGGFALQMKFDETGTWVLEHYTASYNGDHFAIWGQWNEGDFSPFALGDIVNQPLLVAQLKGSTNGVSTWLRTCLSASTLDLLAGYQPTNSDPAPLRAALVDDLNRVIRGPLIYDAQRFSHVPLRKETKKLLAQNPAGDDLLRLNRLLIEDAYPNEFLRDRKKAVDSRWLAAPVISRRLSDGVLTFTADCDRYEADRLTEGLNVDAKNFHKSMLK